MTKAAKVEENARTMYESTGTMNIEQGQMVETEQDDSTKLRDNTIGMDNDNTTMNTTTASETMWEARRARELAEEEADRKLIEAVCKASLAEHNEKTKAIEIYEKEVA